MAIASKPLPTNLTDEQEAIRETARTDRGANLNISAYAGTGKTTTLALLAPGIKVPALALAFNKAIATELASRFPGNFQTKTLNGLGHGAWARAMPGQTITLDDRKIGKLVTQVAKGWGLQLGEEHWGQARQLVSAAMAAGVGPGPGELREDILEVWMDLAAEEIGIPEAECERLAELAREVHHQSVALARQGIVCFDDQWYCPVVLGGRWTRYPVLLVDEGQDLSPMQHQMMLCSSDANTRWIVCGDERQAIYAWRGADAQSLRTLRGHRQSPWTDKLLTLTFRCPQAVVERQQEHAPGYRAAAEAPKGRVPKRHEWHRELSGDAHEAAHKLAGDSLWSWNFRDLEKLRPTADATMAVLCRNNAPLLSLAFKLIRSGVGCRMAGREIGKGLAALARRIAPDPTPIDIFAGKLVEWTDREVALALANGHEGKVDGVRDKSECLQATISGSQARDVRELCSALEAIFANQSGLVLLSTIHKAKGLEWDLVLHLDPWRVAGKKAREAGGEELQQELNLKYVCETRTKSVLAFANVEDYDG